jgi:electron transport complex protein RnfB
MFEWTLIALAAGTMLALALAAGYALGWAKRAFHVDVNPRLERLTQVLPGANCGGCGYVGCTAYAEALHAGAAAVDLCSVGGVSCASALADILGVELKETWPTRPVVHCGARSGDRLLVSDYRGESTCRAASVIGGVQGCAYGCLGLGDCARACRYDAIHVIDGLACVDYEACVGCRACERACPRHVITMVPFKAERMIVIRCSNQDFGRDVKRVCKVGCVGCKACQRLNEIYNVANNVPRIDYSKYDPEKMEELLPATAKCPSKALIFVGRPSEEDRAAAAGERTPAVVAPDFRSVADQTDWRG